MSKCGKYFRSQGKKFLSTKIKYRFTCGAKQQLTDYNEAWNKQIEDACERDEQFVPSAQCMYYSEQAAKCKHLQIKKLK